MTPTELHQAFGYSHGVIDNIRKAKIALELIDVATDRVGPGTERFSAYCFTICCLERSLEESRACLALICAPWFDDSAFGPREE